ncbi:MAG: SpoIID/LytB domain-containing protein [Synergistaceae bacterium]|nr:SpoIID/LytB domain-containing protein [Synergistota bacterium]NLM71664.1 SpoIID/LytB domain-containing protein [Synergistaceae bacterium]
MLKDKNKGAPASTLSLLFAVFLLILMLQSPALARNVSVGLAIGQASVSVKSESAITVVDSGGKKHSVGKSVDFKASAKGCVSAGKLLLKLPVSLSSGHPLSFNGRRYRGSLRLVASGSGVTLLNVIDLEEYLRGVLKMEVNPAWSMEALKAQAIISRTYALRSVLNNKGKGGFDLRDGITSQVYRGINAEDKKTDEAIKSTRGMILKYGGGIAFTPFHSFSGGATADVSTVWGGDMPYLKGVKEDFRTDSPNNHWETRLTPAQVEGALRSAGVNVGRLQELRVEKTDPHGRATVLRAIGTNGTKTLKSHNFRMAAGSNVIKSTVMTITPPGGRIPQSQPDRQPPAEIPTAAPPAGEPLPDIPTSLTPMSASEELKLTQLTEQGAFNSEELMDMLMNPDKRKGYLVKALRSVKPETPAVSPLPKPQPSPPPSYSTDCFVFTGRGWGHGVGLSQWGAKALADKGWSHKQILDFYYPGTKLDKMQ